MALTGCFSATGRLTSPRLRACYISSYLSSTLTSIFPHLSWVGEWVIQFLPSRLIGYLGDLHVPFHLLQVPCPLLRLAFAIGLGFLLRSKCVSQIFDSSGSPAARSVVPLSLFFSFSSLFVYSIPAVLSASPRFLGTSALPSHSSHLTTAPGVALGRAYVGWLRRFASPAKDDSRTGS